MQGRDWLVTGDGQCIGCKSARDWDLLRNNYRLYRFLTEVEDVLDDVLDEASHLPELRMLVRRLIINCYWIYVQNLEPCSDNETSVTLLYDELGFPFTVQTVTFAPGVKSNVHNHGTWGIVAVLKGQEKNTFWRRTPNDEFKDKIESTGEITLSPDDIISFTPDAIHCVEAVGDEPTVTFNIYGETDPTRRFDFDPVNHTAKKF
jgi:predicted metal-dependent enzyme (double-stranded beta helix superfamily)